MIEKQYISMKKRDLEKKKRKKRCEIEEKEFEEWMEVYI